MCLILFSWKTHPKYKLIVAANRDEFYARPTAPAGFWPEHPGILAGKDLQAGGTWLGIEKSGYFAAVTNYRDMAAIKAHAISRGELTKNYLVEKNPPEAYLSHIASERNSFNGFNLIISDLNRLCYYSNIENKIKILNKGVYGLSNHLLDTSWPKVEKGKSGFKETTKNNNINTNHLFELLRNVDQADEGKLPSTGISLDLERALSSIFIKTPDYGTYSSTVMLIDYADNCNYEERTYAAQEETAKKFEFKIKNQISA